MMKTISQLTNALYWEKAYNELSWVIFFLMTLKTSWSIMITAIYKIRFPIGIETFQVFVNLSLTKQLNSRILQIK